MKTKFFFGLLIFVFFTPMLHAQQPGGDIPVRAEGIGPMKKDALLQAKRNAVEQGIGTIVISETELKNFELQRDVVLTKTVGSVKKYDVVDEGPRDDGYFVKIDAVVSLADIRKDLAALKILLESMNKPRMMVVVQEENGKTAESAITDFLSEKGFELVDASVTAALMKKDEKLIAKAAAGDPVAAAQIGISNGAEYVIVGNMVKSVMQTDVLGSPGMKSGQADITAKVIDCSNAKIVASKSAHGAAMHVSEDAAMAMAAEKASQQLMDRKLFEKIVASFQDMANNGISLGVTVKGVSDFQTQKAVSEMLGGLPDTVSVNRRGFGGGQLDLDVLYKGGPDTLAEAVDGKTVKDKKLSVTDISGNGIVIEMK